MCRRFTAAFFRLFSRRTRCMRMVSWLLHWTACVMLFEALDVMGFSFSASTAKGITLPMLLDFQPVVLPLDPTADVQRQLVQFCVAHALDLQQCSVLYDAVSSIVSLSSQQSCRPSETVLRPSFALVKNLLATLDSSSLQPSFEWLEDAPDNIASDICGFLARSHATVDASVADGCTTPLAQAISRSFEWINLLPACKLHGLRATGREKMRVAVVKGPLAVDQITLTQWELSDPEGESPRSVGTAGDDEEEARPTDHRIRIAPIVESIDETGVTVMGTSNETSAHSGAFMTEAVVAMALFAVVMMASWLRILLDRQPKPPKPPSERDESDRDVNVLPLSCDSARVDTVKVPHNHGRFVDGFVIIHRVHNGKVARIAWLRWRSIVKAPFSLSVDTSASLSLPEKHDTPKLNALVEDEEPLTPARTPRSSSTHHRVPSFSLAAMNFLMIPCSPMASSSPRSDQVCPDTPLARVTRLLEAESATDELLDQFDAARLEAERQSWAARRIQRVWRSSRVSSHSDKKDAAKRSRVARAASHLLRRVRQLPSRLSNTRRDTVGQSASSA